MLCDMHLSSDVWQGWPWWRVWLIEEDSLRQWKHLGLPPHSGWRGIPDLQSGSWTSQPSQHTSHLRHTTRFKPGCFHHLAYSLSINASTSPARNNMLVLCVPRLLGLRLLVNPDGLHHIYWRCRAAFTWIVGQVWIICSSEVAVAVCVQDFEVCRPDFRTGHAAQKHDSSGC